MTLFLDRHSLTDVTAADVASAHELDLGAQHAYGVRYLTYWYDDRTGRIFCLAEGPDRQSVEEVHRKAHGLVAEEIIEVGEEPLNAFLGALPDHPPGEAYVDSALRAILFTTYAVRRSRPNGSETTGTWSSCGSTTGPYATP